MSRKKTKKNSAARRKAKRNRVLRLEQLEARRVLSGAPLHNPVRPADVNNDGQINPLDAMISVERLRSGRGPDSGEAFFDVNADGRFNAADPLAAIDGLRRHHRGPRDAPAPELRSIDGVDNNEVNAEWGSAGEALLRITDPDYADGVSEPSGGDRPSAREISNTVFTQTESVENDRGLSDLLWQWGQFLDHDIDHTGPVEPSESFPIEVPTGDFHFDPQGTGEAVINLTRSDYDHTTGDSVDNPRQQVNAITSFIDGSNVYGSDQERSDALRTFEGGRLKTSEGDLLPFNEAGLDNAGGTSSSLFLAGDVRANEQAGLIAMHTLWVREHNRIADRIAAEHPELEDEQIFQRARMMVIAEMQAITFNEFLPALLGEDAIDRYRGYDENVNPGISNMFSTAAYRFGHSMLSSELLRLDANGETIEAGNLSLQDAFFNPSIISDNGIDSLLRGLASQTAQEIDAQVIDDVRNFLFGPPGSGGFDLVSLNIQRGRDHGLPSYNDAREQLGLDRAESFADITDDPQVQAQLEAAYGDVDLVDAWVGVLAESHLPGSSVGELAQTVIVEQFERLRDGDRFWYQRTLRGEQLRQVENTTLADVIQRNTEIDGLQRNVFFTADAQPAPGNPDGGGNGGGGNDGGGNDGRGPDQGPTDPPPRDGQRDRRNDQAGRNQAGPQQPTDQLVDAGGQSAALERGPDSLALGELELDSLLSPEVNLEEVDQLFGRLGRDGQL